MSPRTRVVLVVKYFPPYPRISGVLTFMALLARELGRHVDVHVVTSTLPADCERIETVQNCTVHRVQWPFPVTAAARVNALRPTATICVSGIFDLEQAAIYFAPVVAASRRRGRTWLFQATWPQRAPGRAFRSLAAAVDGVLGASDGLSRRIEEGGVSATVFEPAVDLGGLRAASASVSSSHDDDRFRVGFVNHLNEVKGADLAVEAITRLAERHETMCFEVAGDGALRDDLLRRCSSTPRTRFRGFLPDDIRMSLLASCNVLLLPFRQAESVLGVSQTALEAMALGSVVVGSHTDSLTPAIESGRTGVLIDLGSLGADSIVDEVERLHRDRSGLQRLRDAASAEMTARWSVERRAEELLALIGAR